MAARKLEVQIVGDSKSLERAFGRAGSASDSFASKMGGGALKVAKVTAFATAATAGLAGVVGTKLVKAAMESEKVQARMQQQLKALGISYDAHASKIDKVIEKTSMLSGLDDEDLTDSFANLTRVTGDVNRALELTALTADVARGKNVSLEQATSIVTKAQLGQLGALKRMGIEIHPVTEAQDALKASTDKATDAQVKAAKAADQTATRQAAVAALQQKFGGAAEAYGRTTQGAIDRASVAWGNLQETLGAKLLPVVTRVINWILDHMPQIERVSQRVFRAVEQVWKQVLEPTFKAIIAAVKFVADAAERYWPVVRRAAESVARWYQQNLKPAIENVISALSAIWDRFGGAITRVARTAFNSVLTIVSTVMKNIKGVIEIVLAVIRGDWGKAWNELKGIVSRTIGAAVQVVRNAAGMFLEAARAIGKALVDGIVAGAANIGSALKKKLMDGIGGALNAVKSGFGIFSPSKVTEDEIGKPLAQGVIVGAVLGLRDLPDKVSDSVRAAIDRAREKVEASRSSFRDAWSLFATDALTAFDARTDTLLGKVEAKLASRVASIERTLGRRLSVIAGARGNQTGSERELDALRSIRDAERRAADMAAAQAALASAEDEAARQAAQKRIRDLELDELERTLAEKAAVERAALDERMRRESEEATQRAEILKRAAEQAASSERLDLSASQALRRRHFEQRLAALGEEATKEGMKQSEIQSRLVALLKSFGVNYKSAGKALGQAFARGIEETQAAVLAAASSLQSTAANAIGAAQLAASLPANVSNVASALASNPFLFGAQKRAMGGPVTAGRPYIVGEVGPELFVPSSSGTIIPNGAGGTVINLHIGGSVVTERDLIDAIHTGLLQKGRRNVSLGLT